ncbi:efflux RND transporter permease subunit [Devosia sp. ZB163]|uniref:efflux RND transporter permease subunit n=1 Tax=Devosia sp. ZB163 TaxID=3025938 RepID=UPI0023625273|nr:efflux RND transporter permease subunit [Devosia sp. ZB163]MDC9825888.1 efflux RND transporter permease subunit [Devosia sp. ZB163]
MSIQSQNERGGAIAGLFVRRPVLAIVVSCLIIVAGLAAFFGVEIRELPNVERPTLSISTTFSGASAETVDREITAEIEGVVARIQGVASISSDSSYGRSRVSMTFNDGTNLDNATSDIRDALGRIANRLPDGAETPTIVKADANAQAIIQLAVTSDTMSKDELTELVENTISERLAAVPGVADVQVNGSQNRSFEIDVDQIKLASLGLTVGDIRNALSTMAFDSPAGSLNGTNQNIAIRAIAEVNTPEAFENIVIKGTTRLGDVANVVFSPGAANSGLRSDGKSGIGLGIVRQAQSNTMQISDGVKAAVESLKTTLPPGVDIKISSDESVFIAGAVHEVERSLMIAVIGVIVIIYLFLLDWRATIIPAVTMPVALIGTVAGIYAFGFSLNILTLLALVIATGLVVDDAIVVLENITRRRGMGLGPRAAAVLGTQEVFFAVIATTVTLAAVFIPISFLPGQTGLLFREFGFTLAISVGLSAVVALSLAPMLASRMLKPHTERPPNAMERFGGLLSGFYRHTLRWALNNPLVVIVFALVFAAAAWGVFGTLKQELTPPEDRAQIAINVNAPATVSLDFTRTQMQKIEDMLQPYKDSGEATSIFSISGFGSNTNSGFIIMTLADWEHRTRTQQQIAAEINQQLTQVPGVRANIRQGNSLGVRGGGSGLQFALLGDNYETLSQAANAMKSELEKDEKWGRVSVNYETTQPQMTLSIDRDKAAQLGIDINGLSATMQAMIDGSDVGTVFINDASYSVRMLSTSSPVNDPGDLESIFIKTTDGRYVPMSTIATLNEAPIAPSLGREQQRRAVTVTAALTDGFALGDAYNEAVQIAQPLLPDGATIVPMAEAKTLGDSNNGLLITFGFALIVILLVLAAQFESVWSAIIVMATVPFGLACAVFAMLLTGVTLNVYSQIGLVLVVGIMAKNGILIVEFANQLRDRGQSVREAVENSANIRLRPVVMTMIATVLGGVPLIIAGGAGSEARAALGWIMVGGLSLAAVATLYLTPVAYLLLARFSKPKAVEEERLQRELEAAEALEHGAAPAPAE